MQVPTLIFISHNTHMQLNQYTWVAYYQGIENFKVKSQPWIFIMKIFI